MGKTKTKGEFANRLNASREMYDSSSDNFFGNTVSDGVMQMQLQSFKFGEYINTQDPEKSSLVVDHEWLILSGESESETLRQRIWLNNENGWTQLKATIKTLGHEAPADIDDLEELLADISQEAPIVKGQVKTNVSEKNGKSYQNLNIKQLLESAGSMPEDDPDDASTNGGDQSDLVDGEWAEGDRVVVDFDGTDYAGEISSVDADNEEAEVSFDDDSVETVAFSDLSAEEGDTAAEEPDEDQVALFAFCSAWKDSIDTDVTDDMTADEIVQILKGYEFDDQVSEMTKDEIEILTKFKIIKPPKAKAAVKAKTNGKKAAKGKKTKRGRK